MLQFQNPDKKLGCQLGACMLVKFNSNWFLSYL